MSDLVERLRAGDYRDRPLDEAADEIERLTRELAEARAQTRQAVRKALEEALGIVRMNPALARYRLPSMLSRLDAEEPK